jgi:SecD/SecF fusion protein
LRQKSYLFLLLVLGLGILSGWIYTLRDYHFGLDVQGGVEFTYQMDTSKLTIEQKQSIASVRERLIDILGSRAHGPLGVAEPTVVARGEDQFVVELPVLAKKLDEAEAVMGKSARIEMYWAKNVRTEKRPWGRYSPIEEKGDEPSVSFEDTTTHEVIKPDDPRYKQIIAGWDFILGGDDVKSATPAVGGSGYIPSMSFSSSGSDKMSRWSRSHQDEHAMLATVLDGKVLSIAGLMDNTVLSDAAQITGSFSPAYVTKLCDQINGGSLPVDLKLLSSKQVDATIGKEALKQIETAGVIAFAVVSLFLIAYYAFPGVVAFLALSLYVLFTLSVLKLIGATFSLAGIAGFVLSVGMAVDANILVFERIKEEVMHGRALASAIELGFRRALPAIADSNACTILTSVVLYNLGTGPVKGFAATLIIGVLISLFTAFTVTHSLLAFFVGSGIVTNEKWFALKRNWFGKRFDADASEPLNVVRKSNKWFLISLVTILLGVPAFFMGGFKLNVEFQGGYEASYPVTASSPSSNEITANLEKNGFKGSNVKISTQGTAKFADLTVPHTAQIDDTKLTDIDRGNLIATAAGLNGVKANEFAAVSSSLSKETLRDAIKGVMVSSALIILYLAVRFGTGFGGWASGIRFGLSAIGALVHDILVVLGTAAVVGLIFKWEVGALFLTAMLTMIGFSVHDTIVIFDRIRENLRKQQAGEDFRHLVDRSITQSFARSINTSGTVIVTLLILVFFGTATADLKFFVTAMLIGIISGTYSSIYNASPIMYLWDRAVTRSKGEEFSITAMARSEIARNTIISTSASTVVPDVQSPTSGRSYGQVRRRASGAPKRDDDDL